MVDHDDASAAMTLNPFDHDDAEAQVEGRVALGVLPELRRRTHIVPLRSGDAPGLMIAVAVGVLAGLAVLALLYVLG
jgi:hypothetical protein